MCLQCRVFKQNVNMLCSTFCRIFHYMPVPSIFLCFLQAACSKERGSEQTEKKGKTKRRTVVTRKALMNVCNNLNQWIRKSILQHSAHKTQTSTQWEQSSTERRAAVESRASGTAAHVRQDGDAQETRPRPRQGLPGVGWSLRPLQCCGRKPKGKCIIGSEESQTQTFR